MKIFDITTPQKAYDTFLKLSNISELILNHYITEAKHLSSANESFTTMARNFNFSPTFIPDELICHAQHITTSANGCINIKQHGLKDLQSTYEDTNSELRQFLDSQDIKINLPDKTLSYSGEQFSIAYVEENKNLSAWKVGRKFYYDYNLCGFLSFNRKVYYGGRVNQRPEILHNITDLIHKDVSTIWKNTHKPYVVKFAILYKDLYRDSEGEMDLLESVFYNIVNDPEDKVIITNYGISVPPQDIISIEPLA